MKEIKKLVNIIIAAIEELKGMDITQIDVRDKTSVADVMIIATGRSDRHVRSIADNVIQHAKAEDSQPLGSEGQQAGNWVLVDLGDILVHIMTQDARDFYSLEKLWSTHFDNLEKQKISG